MNVRIILCPSNKPVLDALVGRITIMQDHVGELVFPEMSKDGSKATAEPCFAVFQLFFFLVHVKVLIAVHHFLHGRMVRDGVLLLFHVKEGMIEQSQGDIIILASGFT